MSTDTALKPALELDVLAPDRQRVLLRSTLNPDRKYYELYWESELSMEDVARLATLTKQVEPLVGGADLDPPTARLLDAWLDEALGIIFRTKLEPETIDEMGYQPKWKIIEFFGENCMDLSGDLQSVETTTAKTPALPAKKSRSTGAK